MQDVSRVGPYEVLAPLGAGGMGAVYRAWDPRLKREVAVKVLPDPAGAGAAARERLLEEARAASALSHPNILTVHDVGIDGSTPFIISELVEGCRLADEIERGALPLKRLLDLATQIAAGLRAAHEAGIAHRDLKPNNVMVASDGRVKIVDFGLALADDAASADSTDRVRDNQTLTATMRGTPQYMSPEQARGGRGDHRSDQFSFGLILFEMATGVHPFRRETAVATMGAILEDEPPRIEDLKPRVPPYLRWIIERCLAKDPAERYSSTDDLLKDLNTLRNRWPQITQDERPQTAPSPRFRRAAITGLVVFLVAIALALLLLITTGTPPEPTFSPLVTDAAFQGAPAWSPDGRSLAYVSSVNGTLQVFARNIESLRRAQLTHSRFDCYDPFWSSDGRRIFYHSRLGFSSSGLWSVSAAGGPPTDILESAYRATLSPDGSTLAFLRTEVTTNLRAVDFSLWLASSDGTNARRYTHPPFGPRTFVDAMMRFSPDGSRLLLSGATTSSDHPYTPTFWVVPWPNGSPYEVLLSLGEAARTAVPFDWMHDNRHIVAALWDVRRPATHLWMVDTESGRRTRLTSTPGNENRPALPRDGSQVAFTTEEVDFDLLEIPIDGGMPRPILQTSRNELDPAFAPDGQRYFYVTDRRGPLEIWSGNVADPLAERLVVGAQQFPDNNDIGALGALAVSPDGQRIAFQRYGKQSGHQIWLSSVAAAGPAVELSRGSMYQDMPVWSPDGDWIAFADRRGDRLRLSRVRVGSQDPPEAITDDIAFFSIIDWSPNGRWLLFEPLDGGLAIISPKGTGMRRISEDRWDMAAFAADSSAVYGVRESEEGRRYRVVAVDISTLVERVVLPDLGEIPPAHQPIRGFSRVRLTGFATSKANARSAIYLLDGVATPRTLWQRLAGARGANPGR